MSDIQVLESPREQASDEIIAWEFDFTNRVSVGQTINNVAAIITQLNDGVDRTTTCLGAPVSLAGNHALILVQALTAGKRYRVTARATFADGTIQDADLMLAVPH